MEQLPLLEMSLARLGLMSVSEYPGEALHATGKMATRLAPNRSSAYYSYGLRVPELASKVVDGDTLFKLAEKLEVTRRGPEAVIAALDLQGHPLALWFAENNRAITFPTAHRIVYRCGVETQYSDKKDVKKTYKKQSKEINEDLSKTNKVPVMDKSNFEAVPLCLRKLAT